MTKEELKTSMELIATVERARVAFDTAYRKLAEAEIRIRSLEAKLDIAKRCLASFYESDCDCDCSCCLDAGDVAERALLKIKGVP